MEEFMHQIHDYWKGRSEGYSEYNLQELSDCRRENWKSLLKDRISAYFKGRRPEEIRVLDAGAGPGFLSILLAGCGYQVTALDYTQEMIDAAKVNAGSLAETIRWIRGDVQDTGLPDLCFDVIVSRNVTWNLPHPEAAYQEWFRILDEGGILLNFDANWYAYLTDPEKLKAYERDRKHAADADIEDCNVGEGFDRMEDLARRMPLTGVDRPSWDRKTLLDAGFDQVTMDLDIWEKVWSPDEKISCASTPMFLIEAEKKDIKERVISYWTKRSDSFLNQRRRELHDPIAKRWLRHILPDLPEGRPLKILDAGCGAGFFSILLAAEGHQVTGIDLTSVMVRDARILAQEEGQSCRFLQMDAEHLDFPDETFDVVISRNLTWTLPHPEAAYREWFRVLKHGGVLLNFDANYGPVKTQAQADLPYTHAHSMIGRDMMAENDAIMHLLPISFQHRPAWDAHVLEMCGAESLSIDFRLGSKVYLHKDEFYNPVPVFRLMAVK